ncbi:polysaccharide deacetylase family protein [Candidatus Falkowbacteria bacterium]|jgi:peptidoglycan/xylan/chitin deacetylase (PgdA/CDA1 family)|nr:polysaccharide deacetylase family protein [Elusimicrobiaceae bacterium]MBT4433532.1 polysaccharide deacetylase family protein [Candidatus Falkowbacteria bacterium]
MVKNLKKIEIFFILIMIITFFILVNKYIIKGITSRFEIVEIFNNTKDRTIKKFTPEKKIICNDNQIKISVQEGDLCRKKITDEEREKYQYLEIFDTYPKTVKGREIIYDFLDEGDIEIADAYLNNEIRIERYEPFKVEKITWEEDPYNERYWRFNFYSLQNTRHLLYAYQETKEEKYKDKLIEIVESFINEGIDKPHAWDDFHGVAFRAMTLTNTWWKLRELDVLSIETSEKILKSLEKHGEFLFNEEHYEVEHNHGISQMAALLVSAVNFPDLKGADEWLRVAETRLNKGIKTLVDDDGVLVENSPFYHFYALKKYWQILEYVSKNNIQIDDEFKKIVNKMISYATYILQPNLESPLLGASLKRNVGNAGVFNEMAQDNLEFLYILTQGREGKKPEELNKYYSTTGQVIMRSGWEKKTKFKNEFKDQTQIIFDVGPYRTKHSDFDALSFNLYSNGKTLLLDTGLYTYEDDKFKKYFHGTRGHNTILVDGEDQKIGSPISGKFEQENGYVSHSAQHNLYPQTNHQRSMILLEHDLVLIIDRLISDKKHDYEQLFHLFPGAKIEKNGTTLIARGEKEKEKLTIRQLLPENIEMSSIIGDENTGDGFCSFEYEKKVPCYTLSYKQHAQNTSYITLLEIGNNENYIYSQVKDNKIIINTKDKTYDININELDVKFLDESKLREEVVSSYNLNFVSQNDDWQLTGEGSDKFKVESKDGKLTIIPKNRYEESIFADRPYYIAEIDGVDHYYSIEQNIFTDIPLDKEQEKFKIYEQEDFLPIFGYHHVIPDNQKIKRPTLEMHVSDFEKQIDYATNEMGCRWFTLGDIMENYVLKNQKVPKRACIINFDDGRKNHFTNGFRIFKKYGAVATFYVIIQDNLDNKNISMSMDELNELFKNGNEIGSHTVNASGLLSEKHDREGIIYQLEESKNMLEKEGYKVTTFSYPKGEQNQEIIDLTSKYYLAGRDTEKDNSWRERRSVTSSFDKDYMWHMNYYKPELETPEKLEKSIGYNNWWQFEEGLRINRDNDDDIKTMSSIHPTDNSYAVVRLADQGDQISNKFIISKDGVYVIEIYGTVNTENLSKYASTDTVKMYIDGIWRRIYNEIEEECTVYKKQYYCFYKVPISLKKGVHTISVEANEMNVKMDKFRIYRSIKTQNSYNIEIKELKRIPPREHPHQIEIDINIKKRIPIWIWILLPSIILLLGYFKFKKK